MVQRTVVDGPLTFRVISNEPALPSTSPAFVLIHGVGMSHRYLSRLHNTLAAKSTTFSIDMPGHGGLPKPPTDVNVPRIARGLADVIASLGTGPVALIGHSMGAQWATEVARRNPELVELLVLVGPVVDSSHRTLRAQMTALARDTPKEKPRTNWIVFSDYVRCGIRWYLTQVRHMLNYAIEDAVAQVSTPMLVIRGSRDPIAGRGWCRRLTRRASEARLVEIPGHSHVVQDTAPHAVASAIHSFVAHPCESTDGPPA